MNKTLHFLVVLLITSNFAFAQNDPFGVHSSADDSPLPPNELPSFEVYKKAPKNIHISTISPQELSATLENSRGMCFVLDARSEKEYAVSRIQQARCVGFLNFSVERVWMIDHNAQIIVYSANKERGLVLAQYLSLMGFVDVQLLNNGLIGWKNAGYGVVNNTGETDHIHVGNKKNMRLLKSGLAVLE